MNFDTYLINMQMMEPDISFPEHKACTSDKKIAIFLVDPKASSEREKLLNWLSVKAFLAQSHKRFNIGG